MARLLCILLAVTLFTNKNFSQQPKLVLPVGHTGAIKEIRFTPDGSKLYSYAADNTVKIWDAATGKLLINLNIYSDQPPDMTTPVQFSPDGGSILFVTRPPYIDEEGAGEEHYVPRKDTINIWDVATGTLKFKFTGKESFAFSPDGKRLALAYGTDTTRIFDLVTGGLLNQFLTKKNMPVWGSESEVLHFSPDGRKLITCSAYSTIFLWDILSRKKMELASFDAEGWDNPAKAIFSPDSRKIACFIKKTERATNDTLFIMDAESGAMLQKIKSPIDISENDPEFSPDGNLLLIKKSSEAGPYSIILNTADGKQLFKTNGASYFSPDGKRIASLSADHILSMFNAATGTLLYKLSDHLSDAGLSFSKDGSKIITIDNNHIKKIWDAASGKPLIPEGEMTETKAHSSISQDGSRFISLNENGEAGLWNTASGVLLTGFREKIRAFSARYNKQGNKIILFTDEKAWKWDLISGTIKELAGKPALDDTAFTDLSPDGKKLLLEELKYDGDGAPTAIRVFNTEGISRDKLINGDWGFINSLDLLAVLKDHTDAILTRCFSPDGRFILTASADNTIKIWDANTYKVLYTFFMLNDQDFLVVDKFNHYDGTEAARKQLYFVCGTEMIDLEQVKDQLWVPGLTERINKGEPINAKSLSDLNICNLTPLVEEITADKNEYHFKITPRRGGLGETVLSINSKEFKVYKPAELKKTGNIFELIIPKTRLQDYLTTNESNQLTVRAYTADNTISSRGGVVTVTADSPSAQPPNLYAVMVGISKYKGKELNLKYAAKDATDLSAVVAAAARKFLNNDGKEHVFMYNLTTQEDRYLLPEKAGIIQTLEEIGKKAGPNDILFLFFAGHGIMAGDQKKFYFLTADASSFTDAGAIANTGISMAELTEWMKPQNIKAQKRILVFDACNSGQAINNIVKLGNENQNYLAARNDNKAQQAKEIDKLNEKSGLFILAASASNQGAYEMGRYAQGLLTYSLLKAIKEQPDILEKGTYLNISRWFNAAELTVSIESEKSGARQQPQLAGTANINIGVVDDEVRKKVLLPVEKPKFTRSEFRNTETKIDDLKFRSLVDKKLEIIAGDDNSPFLFSPEYDGDGVYAISGDYSITGDAITISVRLTKSGTEIKTSFLIKRPAAQVDGAANQVVNKIINWLKSNMN